MILKSLYFAMWLVLVPLVAGCAPSRQQQTPPVTPTNTTFPPESGSPAAGPTVSFPSRAPDHIVIVVEENHSYSEIADSGQAPYLHSLMKQGANLTNYHGVEHPSQPNYLDLFSGFNQGITSDSCPHTLSSPNLGSELIKAHFTFSGFSEDLPEAGYTGCSNSVLPWRATYARKHSPWVNFTNVPADNNRPMTDFPTDYNQLPTVSFVIPNLNHDMHNGSIQTADSWLKQHLDGYRQWAADHNSLLIVTFDEDDKSESNHIPTVFVGPMVQPGNYDLSLTHFHLLRTILDLYHLPPLGRSAQVGSIHGIWRS